MFQFDSIQRKLLLIMGVLILILSGGLIYSETRNRRDNSPDPSSIQQQFWNQKQEEIPGFISDGNSASGTHQPKTIQIYITGQVTHPGVYSLPAEERLVDAIEQAGGCTPQADLTRINLAAKLIDEGMYYVPAIGEEITTNIPVTSNGEVGSGKVNINLADQSQLETLTGIGPAKALKIIEYREQNGGFQSIEEIMNVSGIGEKTFENVKEQISIK